jgi:hypothetical protein
MIRKTLYAVFRTASLQEARKLIEDEPLTKLNLRT